MFRCNGCDRELRENERFIEAALEYRFCLDCISIDTVKESNDRQLLLDVS